MADFARVLAAVDAELGTNGLARYMSRASQLSEDSLQSDPFIESLRDVCIEPIVGKTGSELLSIVTSCSEIGRPPKGWPRNGRDVTAALKRNATALRDLGWQIEDDGARNHRNVLLWTIQPPTSEDRITIRPSQSSQSSAKFGGVAKAARVTSEEDVAFRRVPSRNANIERRNNLAKRAVA